MPRRPTRRRRAASPRRGDQKGIDTVAADRVDTLQSALEFAVARVLQGENEGREPHVVVDLDKALREPGRCFDATLGG